MPERTLKKKKKVVPERIDIEICILRENVWIDPVKENIKEYCLRKFGHIDK